MTSYASTLVVRPVKHPCKPADPTKLRASAGSKLKSLPSAVLATTLDQSAAFAQSAFDASYAYPDPTDYSPASLNPPLDSIQPSSTAHKRKTPPSPSGKKPVKKVKRVGPRSDSKAELMTGADGEKDGEGSKPKRVRTGCLTCRARHLKCDEAMPHCNNCRKSNRNCKRGVRLNFIDTWVDRPPTIVTLYGTRDWRVDFLDESREIAKEYVGGTHKYLPLDQDVPYVHQPDPTMTMDFTTAAPPAPSMGQQPLPPIHGILPEQYGQTQPPDMNNMFEAQPKPESGGYPMNPPQHMNPPNSSETDQSLYGTSDSITARGSVVGYHTSDSTLQDEAEEKRGYLKTPEETLFMQVFVEEVGLWMDSMDAQKHFSRLLPFHALGEPMLLNAFLACGARHLTLVNPAYSDEKALHYYDSATRYLLKNLQNPNRDTVICATTAVILNVYEIMSERATQRMNHIAGARALIKECGWNARASGIGAACFWLNVGLEVLSCLHFNWQVAWDPDEWYIDMDFSREIHNGREEVWTHRMLYVIAKICNFRATIPRYQEADARDQQIRTQQRYEQWTRLKGMCDAWNDGIPRTMHPAAYLYPCQTSSKSAFPEVWLIKRSTIVARLFYHTAMLLIAQTNPYFGVDTNPEMADLQNRHSQMICGIAAHVKDRGVVSVALRSLAHAAEVLTNRREQEEVLQIFEKINKETGWRIGYVYKELKDKWGWNEEPSPQQFAQTHTAARLQKEAEEARQEQQLQLQAQQSMQLQQHGFDFNQQQGIQQTMPQNLQQNLQQSMSVPPPQKLPPTPHPAPPTSMAMNKKPPTGILNPMYAKADFTLPQHPYQNYYTPPNSAFGGSTQGGGLFLGI